jgi:hypothetical protein
MGLQHIENMLRRYRGQTISIKTRSGGLYEGIVAEITNDYVALMWDKGDEGKDQVFVLLHSIEAVVLPRNMS